MINRFPKEPFGFFNGGTLGIQSILARNLNNSNWIQTRPFNAIYLMFNFATYATCNGINFFLQQSADGSTPIFDTDQYFQPVANAQSPGGVSSVFQPTSIASNGINIVTPRQYSVDIDAVLFPGHGTGSTIGVLIRQIVQPFVRLYRIVAMGATTDVITVSAQLKQLQA
jgi:hypothetical protein